MQLEIMLNVNRTNSIKQQTIKLKTGNIVLKLLDSKDDSKRNLIQKKNLKIYSSFTHEIKKF